MIERELNKNMYDLIKMTKGFWSAFFYSTSGMLYGYRLSDGYVLGQNILLDMVLQDLNIQYKLSPEDLIELED